MARSFQQKKPGLWTRPFLWLDHVFDGLYGSKFNPLYQSGVVAVFLLGIVIVTGIYLVFFYKVSAPYESVANLQSQVWLGKWIRAVHRYASDATIVAVFFHVVRMLIQGRSWGVRVIAWISGIVLTGVLLFCGITGLMLVWDVQGQFLAVEMARLFDVLPIFSEPLLRAFQSTQTLPRSFFFLALFMHVSLPLGLALLFWVHTSRVARPSMVPPRGLMVGLGAAFVALSVFWGLPLADKADPLAMTGTMPVDLFYGFFIPATLHLSPILNISIWVAGLTLLTIVPWLMKPKPGERPAPSFVHEKSCTGCTSCYNDCPFNAISMVARTVGAGSDEVAKVNPDLCVSCGICSASCDPMGVGPAGRTGRDQIKAMEVFLNEQPQMPSVLVISCQYSVPTENLKTKGVASYVVHCSGGIHAAVAEYALRRGVGGVFIVTCPPRNCANREGPKWLHARFYEGHESALRDTVDRRRLNIVAYEPLDVASANRDLEHFCAQIAALDKLQANAKVEIDLVCENTTKDNNV